MALDYPTLETLRRQHPAWRLLATEHAPMIDSFLRRAFFEPIAQESVTVGRRT